ncbi:MAG TPA: DUF1684 domain-containing protein [Ferruginibacter sp.]|nr:DUF1684 domain-containing protein [Ferruginibacter sp.]
MKKNLLLIISIFLSHWVFAQQDAYVKSIKAYQKNYKATHEVVKGRDRKYFRFFPITEKYNIRCTFEKITDSIGFTMNTSAKTQKHYYKYGKLDFKIDAVEYHLFVYQSKDLLQDEKYKNYLFVPFTDATSGDESYGSGRYLEFYIDDIQNNQLQLDFNKAYNPYCAYSPNYKCPIPPKENFLPVAIKAGEMNFAKAH